MRYYVFNYYNQFKCIKDKCKHSCCKGWEIDLDKRAVNKYRNYNGGYKSAVISGIDIKNNRIKRDTNGRCVFLDENNLCKLIINAGENYLCRVCRVHPRFYNYFDGEKETGLGLSCEEATRIILNFNDKIMPVLVNEKGINKENSPFDKKVKSAREELLNIAQDRKKTIIERLNAIEKKCKFLDGYDLKFWRDFFLKLEKTDEEFDNNLSKMSFLDIKINGLDIPIEQLLSYFIYRHVSSAFDETDIKVKTAFSVLSVKIILSVLLGLCKKPNVDSLIEVARSYSQEIEYSENNLNAIFSEIENHLSFL